MTLSIDQLIQLIGLIIVIGGGIISVIAVYVNLTNKLTRLETKVESHEKKHDTLDEALRMLNEKMDELKNILIKS